MEALTLYLILIAETLFTLHPKNPLAETGEARMKKGDSTCNAPDQHARFSCQKKLAKNLAKSRSRSEVLEDDHLVGWVRDTRARRFLRARVGSATLARLNITFLQRISRR
jgi:hypothetical protein